MGGHDPGAVPYCMSASSGPVAQLPGDTIAVTKAAAIRRALLPAAHPAAPALHGSICSVHLDRNWPVLPRSYPRSTAFTTAASRHTVLVPAGLPLRLCCPIQSPSLSLSSSSSSLVCFIVHCLPHSRRVRPWIAG